MSPSLCLILCACLRYSLRSNAVVLWLGMDPPDVFVYIFLPPLLLDSAVRMDFFLLKKVTPLTVVGMCTCH